MYSFRADEWEIHVTLKLQQSLNDGAIETMLWRGIEAYRLFTAQGIPAL